MKTAPAQHDRLRMIEERTRDAGFVRIDELAEAYGVSEMTIRRDLDELQVLGVARRVRGGAVSVGPEPFFERHRHNARAKARIADKLLDLLPERGTVAFDASSTIHRLAADLEGARDLVIVTNGLDTFSAMAGKPGLSPTLTGGSADPRTGSLTGPVATRAARDFVFDLFICSGSAIDVHIGSSEASLDEAEVKRAFASSCKRVILAVDHTKLGTRAQARMFSLDHVELLVTDLDPGDSRLDGYRNGVQIR
jgi:DeoR family transcriptional regulator, fructose operon transcriptional repressor